MHRSLRTVEVYVVLFILLLAATGCASTALGKAVQVAQAQKIAVESAADEVMRLHFRDKTISDADYVKAKAAYEKWAVAEKALAESFILWKNLKTSAADQRLQTALATEAPLRGGLIDLACSFKKPASPLASICASLGR
jgi:alkylation response protein AidB-like acyl-CoA dehydrogenase